MIPDNLVSVLGFEVNGDLGSETIYTSKNKRIVHYPKAPPDKPPSDLQSRQRSRFQDAIENWNDLDPTTKRLWELLSLHAYLPMTGHNLFIHLSFSQDQAALDTLNRQTLFNLQLPDPV